MDRVSTTDASEGLPAEFGKDTAGMVDFSGSFLRAINECGGCGKVAVFLDHGSGAGVCGGLVCGS